MRCFNFSLNNCAAVSVVPYRLIVPKVASCLFTLIQNTVALYRNYMMIICVLEFVFPGYDMSPFIRRYAKYLNEKALSYRTVAFDFCKVKRG